ncbi:MAG TPA: hypothetical protein VII06_09495 [Chloroflexota bacterium]|jgi:hypothetical protein
MRRVVRAGRVTRNYVIDEDQARALAEAGRELGLSASAVLRGTIPAGLPVWLREERLRRRRDTEAVKEAGR